MKVVKYILLSIVMLFVCVYIYDYKLNNYRLINTLVKIVHSGDENNNSMENPIDGSTPNEEIRYRSKISKINYLVLNSDYGQLQSGVRDILASSENVNDRYFIGQNSFTASSKFKNVQIQPSNIWNMILHGLVHYVNLTNINIKQSISIKDPIPLNYSIINNTSTIDIENQLVTQLSKYIDPSFADLVLIDKFSNQQSKDKLVYLVSVLGKTKNIYEYYYSFNNPKRLERVSANILNQKYQLMGTVEDYQIIKSKIQSIFNYLSQSLNSDPTISSDDKLFQNYNLYDWYEHNKHSIDLIIQYLFEEPNYYQSNISNYKLNIVLLDFAKFNSPSPLAGPGYSYIPIKISNNSQVSGNPYPQTKIFAGHFGVSFLDSNDNEINYENSTVVPNLDWLISNYYSNL